MRGIPEIMSFGILMLMWSFGALRTGGCHKTRSVGPHSRPLGSLDDGLRFGGFPRLGLWESF